MQYTKDVCCHPENGEHSLRPEVRTIENDIRANKRARDLNVKLRRIKGTKTLDENVQSILEFDKECEQNGHKIAYRYSRLVVLHNLCQFAGKKPFTKFSKTDVIQFLDAARNRRFQDARHRARLRPDHVEKKLSNSSMNLTKLHVKRFFHWISGNERGVYPQSVKWIELATVKGDREITPEGLPTAEEVKRMIECTEHPRDRTLIALLAESGARCGEISTLLLKDISWTERGFTLTIRGCNSKSGFTRRIPICGCVEDVKDYINNFHPFKGDEGSPLFVRFINHAMPKTNLKVDGVARVVRLAAIRSGVEKRIHVHPHLFRHLRASQLAEMGWNEPMLRQFFGWSKTSKMPATYIHMSQNAMNERYYQMYGKANHKAKPLSALKTSAACPNCGVQNPSGYRFCYRCSAGLNAQDKQRFDNVKHVKDTLNLIAQDKELSGKLLQLIEEANKRQTNA